MNVDERAGHELQTSEKLTPPGSAAIKYVGTEIREVRAAKEPRVIKAGQLVQVNEKEPTERNASTREVRLLKDPNVDR